MLINLDTIVSKYGSPKGVIHMGAHLAEELEDYQRHNIKDVIWIEANPYLYENRKQNTLRGCRLRPCTSVGAAVKVPRG